MQILESTVLLVRLLTSFCPYRVEKFRFYISLRGLKLELKLDITDFLRTGVAIHSLIAVIAQILNNNLLVFILEKRGDAIAANPGNGTTPEFCILVLAGSTIIVTSKVEDVNKGHHRHRGPLMRRLL